MLPGGTCFPQTTSASPNRHIRTSGPQQKRTRSKTEKALGFRAQWEKSRARDLQAELGSTAGTSAWTRGCCVALLTTCPPSNHPNHHGQLLHKHPALSEGRDAAAFQTPACTPLPFYDTHQNLILTPGLSKSMVIFKNQAQ